MVILGLFGDVSLSGFRFISPILVFIGPIFNFIGPIS